jgi:hypothetical protein
MASLRLWKYNKITGLWNVEREVTPATADEWLRVFKSDEPDATFKVSKSRPAHPHLKKRRNLSALSDSSDDTLLGLGLLAAAGAGAYFLLKKRSGGAAAPSGGGSGVLLPQYQTQSYPSSLNIDWQNLPSSTPGSGVLLPQYQTAQPVVQATPAKTGLETLQTPLGPYTPPSGVLMGLGSLGAATTDPRPVLWMQLADQIQGAQAQIDSAWSNYSSSFLNQVCSGTGLCPSFQSTANLVASTRDLSSGLVALAHELADNPDAKYDDGSKKSANFEALGGKFVGNMSSVLTQLGENSWTAAARDFVVRFPQSIRDTLSWTVDSAGNLVQQASWSLAKTALVIGGAAAAVFWLVGKSGAKLDLGPLKI